MAGANRYNFLIVFVVALGSFTYGFNNSIIGSVFGLPAFFDYFDLSWESTDPQTSAIIGATNGLFFGGGLIGCLIVAWLADKVGRVPNLQIICVIGVISAIIQGASVHIAMFLVGRFLSGLASGMINVSCPLYQSEIAPARQRGRMVGSHGFLLVVGYGMAGWAGYGCYFEDNPDVGWRLLLSLQVITPAALLLATPWVPESPRWLIINNKREKGMQVLKRLHHTKEDTNDILAREEFMQIERQIELEKSKPQTFLAMWKVPSYRRRILTGFGLQVLAQSTGVLVVNNYQVLLYNGLGLYGSLPLLLYAVYTSWAAFLNWVASMVVDRFGRVRMLSIGITGCGLMLSCFTAMVARFSGTSNKVGNGFGVFFLYAFVTFYGLCIDAITFVYVTEIFPTHARAQGVAISIAGFLGAALVYNEIAPTAFQNIGWKYYLVFVCVTLVFVPVFWYYSPETKGLTLEEIGRLFGDEVAIDITHMTVEEREKFDRDLLKGDGVGESDKSSNIEQRERVEVHEKLT